MDGGIGGLNDAQYCRPISSMEAEKLLRSGIVYLSMPSSHSDWITMQSCDCWEVLICTGQGLLLVKYGQKECENGKEGKGRILFFSMDSFSSDLFDWKVYPPKDGNIQLKQIHYDEQSRADAMKFLYGSRMLYLFAVDGNLVVTKSVNELLPELFEDEKGYPIIDDDSVLFG